MRFKRGRKVEVFSQNEVPSGSWRCAEIACGNGHAYTVKYYGNLDAYGEAEEVFERVSRKAIRPCPPLMQVPENWSPGDLVEVFHYFSWKTATVLKILSRNQVLVRLLGTSQELKVGKLDIRVRLCWQGDEWIVIGKSCGNSEESRPNLPSTGKFNHNSGLKYATANLYFKDGRFATRNVNNFQEPDIIPSGKLKRRSPYCSQIGEYGPRNKIRVYEKEPRRLIFFVQPVLPKKSCVQQQLKVLLICDVLVYFLGIRMLKNLHSPNSSLLVYQKIHACSISLLAVAMSVQRFCLYFGLSL